MLWQTVLVTLAFLALVWALPLDARDDTPLPFTEMEQLRIENVRLEGIILQRQLQDWQAKRDALAADVMKVRPGWLWNPETGAFTKKDTK